MKKKRRREETSEEEEDSDEENEYQPTKSKKLTKHVPPSTKQRKGKRTLDIDSESDYESERKYEASKPSKKLPVMAKPNRASESHPTQRWTELNQKITKHVPPSTKQTKGKRTLDVDSESDYESQRKREASKPSKRLPVMSKPNRSSESHPKQRWTELTAVGHILADEIYFYLSSNKLSEGEQRQLNTWNVAVEKRIYQQSGLILENVHLATELRNLLTSVDYLRDDLMVLRTQTKRLEAESRALEGQVSQAKKDEDNLQGASTFLSAIQNLSQSLSHDLSST